MTANVRLLVGSEADDASLVASSQMGGLVVGNLQKSDKEFVWRSETPSMTTITGTFTTAKAISCLLLSGHNLSSAATIELKLKVDTTVVYESGQYSPSATKPLGLWRVGIDPFGGTYDSELKNRVARLWMPSVVIANNFELIIRDPENPEGYVQVSRLMAGQYIEPEWNFDWGAGMDHIDPTKHTRMEGGGLTSEKGIVSRTISVTLSHLTENDRIRFEMDFGTQGKDKDVFISLYPEQGGMLEVTHQLVGRRENNIRPVHSRAKAWSVNITVIES